MFVTFSKGYPVHEHEVQEFFTMSYGDCIEMFQMQEVEPDEQALFARIVFRSVSTIDAILRGQPRMKYTINGKHIWARKFIPKQRPPPPPPAPPCLTSNNVRRWSLNCIFKYGRWWNIDDLFEEKVKNEILTVEFVPLITSMYFKRNIFLPYITVFELFYSHTPNIYIHIL